ncbi:MAG: thiamine diphosphokinase [Termitinemataceae bacterium]|nr:MAG: thiamine diphosphokinase [Termitinemataceae bacterium]
MKGIVFTGGEHPKIEMCQELAKDAELIAAADSGLIVCENANIMPQIIAGDMDSIDNIERLNKYPENIIHRYPCGKDLTDTQIAIKLLREGGCSEITIVGGGGGRIDHLLGIYKLFEKKESPIRWITTNEDMYKVSKSFSKKTDAGKIISVVPLEQNCAATSTGLKWKLDGVCWDKIISGTSNVAVSEEIKIEVIAGSFLVIFL